MNNILTMTDFYKTDHRRQYPKGTTKIYSNLTARKSRIGGIDKVVFFGLQYFIKEYLIKIFDDSFFNKSIDEVIISYKRRLDNSLGKDTIPMDHILALHQLGYLPIKIKALKEGTLCPIKCPMLTIENTHPDFFWVTNFLESIMSNILWMPITSATIAREYKKIFDKYAKKTSSNEDFTKWQGHDFSFRGMAGYEAACISGAGHLLSFTGTDTIPAIDFLEKYYNADSDKELIAGSVFATEHSVQSMGTKENETETYIRLLTEVYPKGIVSIVSDTYDFWNVLTKILPSIKDIIMRRDGKLVVRPDTGDPVKIICGDVEFHDMTSPEFMGAIEILYNIFGGKINNKGYKELDPHIGLIYGDSITLERCQSICERLEAEHFASTNVVLGIGSFTYQYVTRDTFGMAIKSTYGEINGKPLEIFKDPATDLNHEKKSAKGLIKVYEEDKHIIFKDQCTKEEADIGLLENVFLDGRLIREQSLSEIRGIINDKNNF